MVTLGALALSAQWGAVVSPGPDLGRAAAIVSVIAWVGSLVVFLAACWWWLANRSFGLSPAPLQAAGGSRSHLGRWVLGILGVIVAMMAMLMLARNMG